ncbi:hypothetical protein [Candidatus Enterococcus huntleyi]|uniref:hypothetical protein n=1 Tax=Candidatus Enterococcus huntleyi TaxID=1857217 RepID=UPI001379A028|nr:hypothetical protein [Enterococcus sp. JM4C]
MKKRSNQFKTVVMLVMAVLLVGCSDSAKDGSKKNPDGESTEEKIIKKLEGDWLAEEYDGEIHTIAYEKGILSFDTAALEIEGAKKNSLSTHEVSEERSHYNFELSKDTVTVKRYYETEQESGNPSAGGALAPIKMRRPKQVTQENILGEWHSVEEDYPVFVRITETDTKDQLTLEESEDPSFMYSDKTLLKKESKSKEFSYLTEEGSVRYTFSYGSHDNLYIISSTTDEASEGTARPYILEEINEE